MDTDNTRDLLRDLIQRLDRIEDKLDVLQKGNVKLGNHIDLVENVADMVKDPIRQILRIDLGKCFRSIEQSPSNHI